MKKRIYDMQGLVFFGKIISTALLFFGYIVLGLYMGKYFISKGYPHWTMTVSTLAGTVLGLLHGAKAISDIVKKAKKQDR